jgi:hypothetical protein
MTYLALIGLAVMWAAVLLPPRIADLRRSGGRGRSSIDTFQHQLHLLGRGATTSPATHLIVRSSATVGPVAPRGARTPAARRRRDVLVALGLTAVATLVAWALTGATVLLVLSVVVDAALVGYVLMLARVSRVRREHAHKVRYLPARPSPALDAAWLPRTGS